MDFHLIRDRAGYSVGNVQPDFLGLGGLGSEVCPHGLNDVNKVVHEGIAQRMLLDAADQYPNESVKATLLVRKRDTEPTTFLIHSDLCYLMDYEQLFARWQG